MVRRCLRKRGWVEIDYYKNKSSGKTPAKGAPPKRGRSGKGKVERAKESAKESAEEGDYDDADSDVDLDLGLSDDDNEDEEEYSLVVS